MTTADDLLRRVQQFLDNGDLTGEALRLSIAVDEYLDAPKDDKAAPAVALTDVPEMDFGMKDEPFAWMIDYKGYLMGVSPKIFPEAFPVYLHSPTKTAPMKPMTSEEIEKQYEIDKEYFGESVMRAFFNGIRFAERHHGIGGGDE